MSTITATLLSRSFKPVWSTRIHNKRLEITKLIVASSPYFNSSDFILPLLLNTHAFCRKKLKINPYKKLTV